MANLTKFPFSSSGNTASTDRWQTYYYKRRSRDSRNNDTRKIYRKEKRRRRRKGLLSFFLKERKREIGPREMKLVLVTVAPAQPSPVLLLLTSYIYSWS